MNLPIPMRYHKELPKQYKLNQITISKIMINTIFHEVSHIEKK